jgi:hypothetical protein
MKKTPEELRRLMDLRRSNAASAVPSKKQYKRNRQSTRKMLDLSKEQKETPNG